jgi:hypothetical protein
MERNTPQESPPAVAGEIEAATFSKYLIMNLTLSFARGVPF